jgi:hypothetical protein
MLKFMALDYRTAAALVVEHHYLHRKCPVSWAWGIRTDEGILGVMTVGKPVTWSSGASLVGETKAHKDIEGARSRDVYELNRLWLSDKLPVTKTEGIDRKTGEPREHAHGLESRFIGWCLRQLKKERPKAILFSLADGEYGHVGNVYKATNFIYTGSSIPFNDICVEGFGDYRSVGMPMRGGFVYRCAVCGVFPTPYCESGQPETLVCSCGKEAKRLNKRSWAITDVVYDSQNKPHKVFRKQRSIKHRYVWFADPKDRSILAWPVLPYPNEAANQEVY